MLPLHLAGLTAALLAGCSLFFDIDRDQCVADRDCARFGAQYRCQAGLCESLDQALVLCDESFGVSRCPADRAGVPMTCHAASQLGGQDFCTETCDPEAEAKPGHECLASGALLRQCDPKHEPSDCPAPLRCHRTDLKLMLELYPPQSTGLCTTVPVCNDHSDCSGERSVCTSEVLRTLVTDLEASSADAGTSSLLTAVLPFDHLHCVPPCGEGGTCPPGQACLSEQTLPFLSIDVPDICVPQCECEGDCADARSPCPPDYYCAAAAGPPYPKVCLPGLPGNRCRHGEDCLMGYCKEIEPELRTCVIDCLSDDVCGFFDALQQDPFICAEGHCVTRAPFAGEMCVNPDECPAAQTCSSYNPFAVPSQSKLVYPECHAPCDEKGHCTARGGVPYVCMPNGECYPGSFNVRCATEGQACMGDLECLCVENCGSDDADAPLNICTKPCAVDDDCSNNPLTRKGHCDSEIGRCRAPLED